MASCIVALLEPKISGDKAHHIMTSRGFSRSIRVEAEGFSGRIWLLWRDEEVHLSFLSSGKQVINVMVHGVSDWILSIIYASPHPATRELLWEAFADIASTHDYPWLVMGDFNQIANLEDKMGGNQRFIRDMESFATWMECCSFFDLGFTGPRFTWSDSWDTGRRRMKRLDRANANTAWRLLFPDALVNNLPKRSSDHAPLLMTFNNKTTSLTRHDKLFKFEATWIAKAKKHMHTV
ncbi:uncharacterized protein LOC141594481 [Silene latifolia]|uniref:uncharacterized protein LOC141594481 n=1 Tax=Silene latifolia TaxID=37657 RepID=UPI003D778EF4